MFSSRIIGALTLLTVFLFVSCNGQKDNSGSKNNINLDSSPWVWVCREPRGCVKVDQSDTLEDGETGQSLAACKLTCHSVAMLWPLPRGSFQLGRSLVTFQLSDLKFDSISAPNRKVKDLMNEAIAVFREVIEKSITSGVVGRADDASKDKTTSSGRPRKPNPQMNVEIDIASSETVQTLNTKESYSLTITSEFSTSKNRQGSSNTSSTTIKIVAVSFFGARHALETLSQLMVWDDSVKSMILLTDVEIVDSPAFPHRGLLLDSSRNFITMKVLKSTIDAMAYNKLNVLHWHLTDTHSFPFVSTREPRLAYYGAYSPSQVYKPEDVKEIVHYAKIRGVKVIPEFDAPAHVGTGWEWGEKAGLGQLVLCYNKEPWQDYCVEPPCGQLNPVNDNIYTVLKNIYDDMAELFESDIFHMGGDEVHMRCWNETQDILDWLTKEGRTTRTNDDFIHVWNHFQAKALAQLDLAYGKKQPVVLWTSGLTEEGKADQYLDINRYIIQIWTTGKDESIAKLYNQGFKLIMSNYDAWYFDCGYGAWVGNNSNNWCSPYIGWQKVYSNSPRQIIESFNLTYNADQILGGEAALWSEQVDSYSMEGKLWPRAAALAERLWSDPLTDWTVADTRLVHHRQRMVQRGINADALQPEWCHHNEGYCFL